MATLSMSDLGIAPNGNLKQRLAKYLLSELTGTDADGNMIDPAKYFNSENILAKANTGIAEGLDAGTMKNQALRAMKDSAAATPFLAEGGVAKAGLGDWAKLAGRTAIAHPFKTAGLVGLGAGNLGGLTDNDKFGGQLGGLALGGLGASMLANANPYTAAMLTLGGGELGSLFDKLRAKKEQEQPNNYYR